MKKKLFVFVVLARVLVACKPAVKGGDTSNSETPLELTAANLAGKWVLEGDSSKWYEFKEDKTFTSILLQLQTTALLNLKMENYNYIKQRSLLEKVSLTMLRL